MQVIQRLFTGDAGRGALIDGSVQYKIRDPHRHVVTFIIPRQQWYVKVAPVEWLNSFTYFAETGIKLEQGSVELHQRFQLYMVQN